MLTTLVKERPLIGQNAENTIHCLGNESAEHCSWTFWFKFLTKLCWYTSPWICPRSLSIRQLLFPNNCKKLPSQYRPLSRSLLLTDKIVLRLILQEGGVSSLGKQTYWGSSSTQDWHILFLWKHNRGNPHLLLSSAGLHFVFPFSSKKDYSSIYSVWCFIICP